MADKYTTEELTEIKVKLERLWKVMRVHGLRSYEALARRLGASRTSVWRWRRCKSVPSRWNLYLMDKFMAHKVVRK